MRYYKKILEIDAGYRAAIEELKTIYTDTSDWEALCEICEKECELFGGVNEKIEQYKRIADIAKNKMYNNGLAIRMWNKVLELDPGNEEAMRGISGFLASASDGKKDVASGESESMVLKGLKVVSGVKAIQDRKTSISNKEEADKLKVDIEAQTKSKRDQLNGVLEAFGRYRLDALHHTLGRFLNCMERINKRAKDKEFDFLKKVDIKENELAEMAQIDMKASDAMKTLAVSGGFAAVGLVGTPAAVTAAVTAFATASTGTAISTLSGAAAQSAVLAWLGGGSIAAGGGGMAAGATALATITAGATAGVALVAIGTLASAFYSKKNTESEQYLAEVSKWAAETKKGWVALDAIRDRVYEMQSVTQKLEARALITLEKLEAIADVFDKANEEHAVIFQENALIAKSMTELAQTPILDNEGNINKDANIIIAETEKVMNKDL